MLLVSFLIDSFFDLNWASVPNFKQVALVFISGPSASLNGAAWFIIMLFWHFVILILHIIPEKFCQENRFPSLPKFALIQSYRFPPSTQPNGDK